MSTLQAIVLGLVQGITEFLPISSTAHLVLVPHVLGWQDPGLRFAVWTNAATLLAVVVFFRGDLRSLAADALKGRWQLAGKLLLTSVPVAVVGLAAFGWLSTAGRSVAMIGWTSIVFGLLLAMADRLGRKNRTFDTIGWRDAVIFGCAEALALIPGTSRSGATITAGLALGLDRSAAARFSLLMAIPVGGLAMANDVVALVRGTPADGSILPASPWLPLAVGVVVAGFSAYLMIGWLLRWLEKQSLQVFVVYRVFLGLVLLGWSVFQ